MSLQMIDLSQFGGNYSTDGDSRQSPLDQLHNLGITAERIHKRWLVINVDGLPATHAWRKC